ncbi:MAG: efflux RND transporter permease subunit [Planctomycetaceae bacterium]|nr:efflux RND transporter permease subunit [Planctomycetaceae bacterium]
MSTLFLRNPRLTILTIGLVLVSGISSYLVLPRMEDPLLTERAAFVLTSLPGADAEQVEAQICDPIEDELREIPEIKEVRSISRNGFSTITIELADNIYGNDAPAIWSRIRDRVSDAEARLPATASKPRFEKIEVTAYTRLIALVIEPPTAAQSAVNHTDVQPVLPGIARRLAEELRDQLLTVSGTKDVDIYGDAQEEILVTVDQYALAEMGLSAERVSSAIRASDSRFSAGQINSQRNRIPVTVSGELDSLERIRSIPVESGISGDVVRLGSFAGVQRTVKTPPDELAFVEGKPAVVLACLIRPDQRIDVWNEKSSDVLTRFGGQLPNGLRLVDVFNQSEYVSDRLQHLQQNMLLGAASVMAVVLFMMGWRSAMIVGIALPLSSLMVFSGMRVADIPVHQMSITGLIIAMGLLIDNAIVIVDEISRRRTAGESSVEAVGRTVRHLTVPLLGSTVTTALAFAPIALMPGPAGEFVGSIAVNVIVAIFSSLFLALTVIAAVTGLLISQRPQESERQIRSGNPAEMLFRNGFRSDRLAAMFGSVLISALRHPISGIALSVVIPVLGFLLAGSLPEQFFPPADRDQVAIEIELSPLASIEDCQREALAVRDFLRATDYVADVTWWIGRSAPPFYYNQIAARRNVPRYAQGMIRLRHTDRLHEQINRLQSMVDHSFPESRVLIRQLEQGPPFEAPVELQIFGPDLDRLTEISHRLKSLVQELPEVTHVRSELTEPEPRLQFVVNEDEARLVGISHQTIAAELQSTLDGTVGGMMLEETEELPVRVRVSDPGRSSQTSLESLTTLPGQMPTGLPSPQTFSGIPLSSLGYFELKPEVSAVHREDSRRMTEIQVYLQAGTLPAPVLAKVRTLLAPEVESLPAGYELKFGGEDAQRNDAIGNLMASIGVLAVLMVATLVLSFRSFRLAALIGAVAILAVGCGLGALVAFGFPFGFMAIIGTMGLVGVAINDSIVVLAALMEDDLACRGDLDAVHSIVVKSSRHVLATTLTTIAGFLPLIIAGGGFWPPMAITIAGGVSGATILALFFVPCCFVILSRHGLQKESSDRTTDRLPLFSLHRTPAT